MPESLPAPDFNQLTIPQRLELIELIWESISDTTEALPMPEWHRAELERRLADADAHPEAGIPWEQVKARLRERP